MFRGGVSISTSFICGILRERVPGPNTKYYLRLDILTLGSVSKQVLHSRVHVSTKKPFDGSWQQEHNRVHSAETTCGVSNTAEWASRLTD